MLKIPTVGHLPTPDAKNYWMLLPIWTGQRVENEGFKPPARQRYCQKDPKSASAIQLGISHVEST